MIDPLLFEESEEDQEPSTTSSRFNGVRLTTRIIPAFGAARGGDWCEHFAVSPDVVALSIGDVCGHGAEKFEAMSGVRQAIRNAAYDGCDPAQTLARANRFLQAYDPEESATAIFALFDTRRRSMVYSNAGHPPPLMLGPCGTLFLESPIPDMPLGVDHQAIAALHVVNAPASTLFVFYTDGVSESERDSVRGAIKLRAAATLARDFPHLPTATTIEALMLAPSNFDDAAILTAWTPLTPMIRRRRVGRVTGLASSRQRLQ